jgi:pimeloyl-[acyl-carrier protein] methyl ester esterase
MNRLGGGERRTVDAEQKTSRTERRTPASKPKNTVRDVVFLHGWGSSAAVWTDLQERLGRKFAMHALDLPGYGANPICTPYTLEGMADALAQTAPRRCHVVGWSLGGQVALAWAGRARRQVERVALIATTPCFVRRPGWPHGMESGVLESFACALGKDPQGALRRFSLLQAQGDVASPRVVRHLRAALSGCRAPDTTTLERGLNILLGSDLRSSLHAVKQPVLVLHGSRDRLVPRAAAGYLGRRLYAARLFMQRDSAHAPFLSRPGAVAAALREFLDE